MSSSYICPPVSESSAPVGSSASITSGSLTSARAIATRCFCPPDSSFGRRWRMVRPSSTSPTRRSSSSTLPPSFPPVRSSATFMLAATSYSGISPKSWNTNPTCERRYSSVRVMRSPRKYTSPSVGSSSPPRMLSMVVLPEPLRPSTNTSPREGNASDTLSSASVPPP